MNQKCIVFDYSEENYFRVLNGEWLPPNFSGSLEDAERYANENEGRYIFKLETREGENINVKIWANFKF